LELEHGVNEFHSIIMWYYDRYLRLGDNWFG
jgi:hypothetical protein